jgi:hypothetical protein
MRPMSAAAPDGQALLTTARGAIRAGYALATVAALFPISHDECRVRGAVLRVFRESLAPAPIATSRGSDC